MPKNACPQQLQLLRVAPTAHPHPLLPFFPCCILRILEFLALFCHVLSASCLHFSPLSHFSSCHFSLSHRNPTVCLQVGIWDRNSGCFCLYESNMPSETALLGTGLQQNGSGSSGNFATYKWHRDRIRNIHCPFARGCYVRFLRRVLSSTDRTKQQKWVSHLAPLERAFQMKMKSLTRLRKGIRKNHGDDEGNKKQRWEEKGMHRNMNIISRSQPLPGL